MENGVCFFDRIQYSYLDEINDQRSLCVIQINSITNGSFIRCDELHFRPCFFISQCKWHQLTYYKDSERKTSVASLIGTAFDRESIQFNSIIEIQFNNNNKCSNKKCPTCKL